MKKFDAIFFDFDGVILDSVNIKTVAFGLMFEKYGEDIKNKVVDYHLKNCGVSRYEKFKYYYREYLNKEINEQILNELSAEFSKTVMTEILKAPFIDGAIKTLEKYYKNTNIYIISGTPNDEIKDIVTKRGLEKYFTEVKGSPKNKIELCSEVFDKEHYNPKNCIFIGDAMSDYNCAKHFSMRFLGIVPKNTKSIFPKDVETKNIVEF